MKTNPQTVSEVELIYRSKVKASERPTVRTSKDAYNILKNAFDPDTIDYKESA